MRLWPLPVVMISSLTERGATATVRALEIGAVDCILKPSSQHPDSFAQLADKVKAAAMARFANHRIKPLAPTARAEIPAPRNGKLAAIGASTGGVEALVTILRDFPANCAATLVTLHLPAPFTQTFVQRLDRLCAPKVVEASHGALVVPGTIYVAPGSVDRQQAARLDDRRQRRGLRDHARRIGGAPRQWRARRVLVCARAERTLRDF
jgi:two-component system chemotaxis response regulator CheB